MTFSSWVYYTSSTSPIFVFSSSFHIVGKAWSCWIWIALSLSKLKVNNHRLQCSQVPLISRLHSITVSCSQCYMWIHMCMYVCLRVMTLRGRGCVWMCVRVCIFVCLSHYVQSCLCVSRVDVLKWGHFLSVWCLRNNPTAQKLLQPSASTYLSLYLYCSGYAFQFDYCLLHAV